MSSYEGAKDLTLPVEGSQAARRAFSGALRERTRALLAMSFRELPEGSAVRAALSSVMKADPAPLFAAMRRTNVHVHFEAARDRSERAAHLRQGVATLFSELALAEALPAPIELVAPDRVVVRSARQMLALGGLVRFANGSVTVLGSAPVAEPSHSTSAAGSPSSR